MNVRCSSCNTAYRIDPAKVPEAGVRARCTVCSHVITVTRDEEAASPAPSTVAGVAQPVREPSSSQEEIAASLGEAFIAPPEEPKGGDSQTRVTEAAPPPVPSAEPAFPTPEAVPDVPEAAPPPVPSAEPAFSAPQAVPDVPEAAPSPVPSTEPAFSGPEAVPDLAEATLQPPVSEPDSQSAGPTAVPAGPPETSVPEVPEPVERGGLRVTRPFSDPGPRHTPPPSQPGPQRPTAPVFRATPGRPLQPASAPPAEPKATAPTVAEPAMPVELAEPKATAPTVAEPAMPVVPAAPSPPAAPPAVTKAAAPVGTPPVVPAPPPDQTTKAAVPAQPGPPAPKPVINPFMSRDPKLKARRLARALISDMIVYQPEKRQEALDSGNLKEVFDGEIKKSWEEYVGQVGDEIANSTPYFTEALNEILAGGQPVF